MGLSTQRCPWQFRSLLRFLRASVDYGLQRRPVKLREEKFESMPTVDSCGLDIIFADWDIRPDAFHGSAHYVENLRHLHNGFTKLFHSILLFLPLEILQGPFWNTEVRILRVPRLERNSACTHYTVGNLDYFGR